MRALVATILLGTTVSMPRSCTISFGSGSDNPSQPSSIALPVPFYSQSAMNCGPASIEMWAAYDGITTTQQEIANYIGCSPTGGASQQQILSGVQHFTESGRDAELTFNSGDGVFFSDEVTSITALVPILPIVNGGLHAVVLIGGQWHIDPDNSNLYVWDVWDTVIYNDPLTGPGRVLNAAAWTGFDNTQHIISASASASGPGNFDRYGGMVAIQGSGGVGGKPLPY